MKPAVSILSMFARSPIRPLQQHMHLANQCTHFLILFFQAVMKNDWQTAAALEKQIIESESKADKLKTDLRLNLPKHLFLPFNRSDLLDLLIRQEQMANRVEDIAGLVCGRKMSIPPVLQSIFKEYIDKTCETSHQAYAAVSELDELIGAGFRGRIVDYVKQQIKTLDELETETDELKRQVSQLLFNIENDLPPIEAMFLYKIIDWIGELADSAQGAGNRLLVLMAS